MLDSVHNDVQSTNSVYHFILDITVFYKKVASLSQSQTQLVQLKLCIHPLLLILLRVAGGLEPFTAVE